MARCGSCGGARRGETRTVNNERRVQVDPTAAVFAAATPRFKVVKHAGPQSEGKVFSTQSAAEDYARRTGGIVQIL
jgi:hypothetical protein